MIIKLDTVGKRFTKEWIFKKLTYTFEPDQTYAILGPNGSGKSTLLQVLSGSVTASAGSISYQLAGTDIPVEDIYKHVGYSAPYIQLPEELTLREVLSFHHGFKPFINDLQIADVLAILELEKVADREIRYFSSGMKQRVKLALSILPQSSFVLLDEPATNLDAAGTAWYQKLVGQYKQGRTIIVSSNRPDEYAFCTTHISIADYK